ncbi:MAG: 3-oxoacid CoA-transferase subunit B [Clostridia bacterium]
MDKSLIKAFIAKRVAMEFKDGDIVNLGVGLPTLCTSYLPEGVHIIVHAEVGIIGQGPTPAGDNLDAMHVVDAGGFPASVIVGGAFADSATNFGLIRGGHVDDVVLGGLEVDAHGNLSNWIIPGKRMPGMGGAMDLLVGAKRVIVAMEHTAKGNPKILEKCTLPYTAINCVDLIVTEMGVMDVTPEGIVLKEYNPEFTLEDIQAATAAKLIISPDLKPMPE